MFHCTPAARFFGVLEVVYLRSPLLGLRMRLRSQLMLLRLERKVKLHIEAANNRKSPHPAITEVFWRHLNIDAILSALPVHGESCVGRHAHREVATLHWWQVWQYAAYTGNRSKVGKWMSLSLAPINADQEDASAIIESRPGIEPNLPAWKTRAKPPTNVRRQLKSGRLFSDVRYQRKPLKVVKKQRLRQKLLLWKIRQREVHCAVYVGKVRASLERCIARFRKHLRRKLTSFT